MKDEIKFDEDDGRPVRRITIQLSGRSDEEIADDMEKLFSAMEEDGVEFVPTPNE